MKIKLLFVALCAIAAMTASAQTPWVRISEAAINPAGKPDIGHEFIELQSQYANQDLTGLTLLIIEGDEEINAGSVTAAISLDGKTTGANGILLLRDDPNIVLLPAPSPLANVYAQSYLFGSFDLNNDSVTILLVKGYDGTTDFDIDEDGTADVYPPQGFAEFVDGMGWADGFDNDPSGDPEEEGHTYSEEYGGLVTPLTDRPKGDSWWEPDGFVRFGDTEFACFDTTGTITGPFGMDANQYVIYCNHNKLSMTVAELTNLTGYVTMTPGHPNTVLGDVNLDGVVDDFDLNIINGSFGGPAPEDTPLADMFPVGNPDGVLDDFELNIVNGSFGAGFCN